jgi:hypothetical protein
MTQEPTDKSSPRHERTGLDKDRRLHPLEQDLIAAVKAPTIELSLAEVRKKGLLAVLRKQAGRK